MSKKEPSPEQNPEQIGETIKQLGGLEGVVGAELPEGRTEKDQKLASLNAEVQQLATSRQEIIKEIEESSNDDPVLQAEKARATESLLDAQADRNKVARDSGKP